MMSYLSSLLLLLTPVQSLKIAISENDDSGVGHGDGSGSSAPSIDSLFTSTFVDNLTPAPGTDSSAVAAASNVLTQDATGVATATVVVTGTTVAMAVASASTTADFSATTSTQSVGSGVSVKATAAAKAEIAADAALPTNAVVKSVYVSPTSETVAPSGALTVEIKFKYKVGAGPLQDITVADLTAPIEFSLTKTSAVTMECVTWTGTAWSTVGVTTVSQTATRIDCKVSHLTTGGAAPVGGGAGGDPKVANLQGEKFEILAMGTFSLLSVNTYSNAKKMLTLDATIDRAGDMCGATYIKNATIAGSWIEESKKFTQIRISAAADAPKERALKISFGDEEWSSPKAVAKAMFVNTTSKKSVQFKIHELQISVVVDAHRVRKNGKKTGQFANFLNINVEGVKHLDSEEKMQVGGLLAYDDHKFAEEIPDGCRKTGFHLKEVESNSDTAGKFWSVADIQ